MEEQIVSYLKAEVPRLIAVYLFGSQAQAATTMESDIDVAFLTHERLSVKRVFELKCGLEVLLKQDVDLIDLAQASDVLKVQVLKADRLLLCNDEVERGYFEMYALSDYARLNRERAGILEDFYRGH